MRLAQALLILIGVILVLVSYVPGVPTLAAGIAITALGFGLPLLSELGAG